MVKNQLKSVPQQVKNNNETFLEKEMFDLQYGKNETHSRVRLPSSFARIFL